MGEACALLCLNVILDINEQADLPVLLFRLAGCELQTEEKEKKSDPKLPLCRRL